MTPIRPVSEDHRHEPADYETLEPCPFCGGEPFAYFGKGMGWAQCRESNKCSVHPVTCADTEAEAIAAWNQRTALATRPTGDMREALEAADYEWRGPYGQEKHRIIPPVLFDRILTALTQAPRSCCAEERERCVAAVEREIDSWEQVELRGAMKRQAAKAIRSNSHDG